MKVLFDTNLWISFMIGRRLSSLADVLNRQDVEVYVSEQLLDEIRTVISRPKFDKLISKETRYYFFEMVYDVCQITELLNSDYQIKLSSFFCPITNHCAACKK